MSDLRDTVRGMRYLMLMWADADAASGDESDFQAWAEFDEQVRASGAFVLNGALVPASTGARLVETAIAGHALGEAAASSHIQPACIRDGPTWSIGYGRGEPPIWSAGLTVYIAPERGCSAVVLPMLHTRAIIGIPKWA
jgi:hypothetical protein